MQPDLAHCMQESCVWFDGWLPGPGRSHAKRVAEPGSREMQISSVSLGPGPCGREHAFLLAQLREAARNHRQTSTRPNKFSSGPGWITADNQTCWSCMHAAWLEGAWLSDTSQVTQERQPIMPKVARGRCRARYRSAAVHNQIGATWAPPAGPGGRCICLAHRPLWGVGGLPAYAAARCAPCHACPCPLCSLLCSARCLFIIPFQFRVRALHLQPCIPRPCVLAYGGSYVVGVSK
jgi:hypothetical protein